MDKEKVAYLHMFCLSTGFDIVCENININGGTTILVVKFPVQLHEIFTWAKICL